jgi:hypothetical protein
MCNGAAVTEAERTDKVRNQGREHGLFRACMDQIRSSHTIGQTLRSAALAAGLLTDAKCYAELLGQFYVATAALERRMEELLLTDGDISHDNDNPSSSSSLLLVAKVKTLGYSFKLGYERDLYSLLGPDWKRTIHSWTTEPANRYIQRLETANDAECAAAAFILHGPLIIGGGAMLKPRVERAFGQDATHVFASVIGVARGGRSARRLEFIKLYDALMDKEVPNEESNESSCDNNNFPDARFTVIVQACGEFMQLNNEMMSAVRQAPWWRKYVLASVTAAASALIWRVFAYNEPSAVTTVSPNSTA